eukprot:CAMPEP_0182529046 /NCGR_PEP_ID=MMETSP1323-20130603/4914_1 /TAXON_ID=236787 /ORGANISM="Florenciella parvula, Strain RCC1693" /LENGTH=30 /DNA_ID= /DNA_START= /DNA_END= /DNA_ORIENTATION=
MSGDSIMPSSSSRHAKSKPLLSKIAHEWLM